MKASLLVAVAAAAAASAQLATVVNNCAFDVYFQSVPFTGPDVGALTTLTPGTRASEPFRTTGSTIKLATTRTLNSPLFFGYSLDPGGAGNVYYEFSTQYGNPFAGFNNSLGAGAGCAAFNCAAGDAACYSTPAAQKVLACPQPVNVTASLCVV